ncbi:HNH endonuclease [Labilibaculum sp. DW002]|uniref:HNH endonuclease n=1 Tax=Paralabilibaculum antarcticum TaxID=2912572 RepID=A0ABT5VSR2_9BACT|nr:HNH endonuclease [Labilibaculum sp. DW002]MDE5418462.1 HNH endonuclease [Labilibaculum sp. DW002]
MSQINNQISSLKRGTTKYGPAPHKPILLLAVIEAFEKGEIVNNWIEPTGELLVHFRNIWDQLVFTGHTPNFSLPFFHLKNEKGKFWELITFPGKKLSLTKSSSIKSYRALVDCVAAAKLSEEFYVKVLDPVQREIMRQTILSTYFPNYIESDLLKPELLTEGIRNEILFDPAFNYARKVKRIITEKPKAEVEEELVMRSTTFRKAVKQVYDQQCAVTGLKIDFFATMSMVDACHIIPFAETHDDTITNGIAMSPTIHRAFDRGMLAISDDYTILIHKNVRDYSPSNGLVDYQNRSIFLPGNESFYPSLERIKEHRKRFDF